MLSAFFFSAGSAGSARDNGFFLSPAALEHTEFAEKTWIFVKIKSPIMLVIHFGVVSAGSAASARDKDFFLSPASLEAAEFTGKDKIFKR